MSETIEVSIAFLFALLSMVVTMAAIAFYHIYHHAYWKQKYENLEKI